jgi:hypothetical protein
MRDSGVGAVVGNGRREGVSASARRWLEGVCRSKMAAACPHRRFGFCKEQGDVETNPGLVGGGTPAFPVSAHLAVRLNGRLGVRHVSF